jgi:hypothetical protein
MADVSSIVVGLADTMLLPVVAGAGVGVVVVGVGAGDAVAVVPLPPLPAGGVLPLLLPLLPLGGAGVVLPVLPPGEVLPPVLGGLAGAGLLAGGSGAGLAGGVLVSGAGLALVGEGEGTCGAGGAGLGLGLGEGTGTGEGLGGVALTHADVGVLLPLSAGSTMLSDDWYSGGASSVASSCSMALPAGMQHLRMRADMTEITLPPAPLRACARGVRVRVLGVRGWRARCAGRRTRAWCVARGSQAAQAVLANNRAPWYAAATRERTRTIPAPPDADGDSLAVERCHGRPVCEVSEAQRPAWHHRVRKKVIDLGGVAQDAGVGGAKRIHQRLHGLRAAPSVECRHRTPVSATQQRLLLALRAAWHRRAPVSSATRGCCHCPTCHRTSAC